MQENPLAWEGSAWPQQLWIAPLAEPMGGEWFSEGNGTIRPFTARSRRLECDPEPFLCGGRG